MSLVDQKETIERRMKNLSEVIDKKHESIRILMINFEKGLEDWERIKGLIFEDKYSLNAESVRTDYIKLLSDCTIQGGRIHTMSVPKKYSDLINLKYGYHRGLDPKCFDKIQPSEMIREAFDVVSEEIVFLEEGHRILFDHYNKDGKIYINKFSQVEYWSN